MRSRTRRVIESAAAAVLVIGASAATAAAQVLFTTAADWGGSSLSNDATQTGYLGWGTRGSDYPPNASTSFGSPEDLSFNGPDLDGSTTNGIGNYDSNNDNAVTGANDPNFNFTAPTLYGGKTSPGGSMTIQDYQGNYDTVTTGEMLEGGTTSGDVPFLNAITQNGANQGVLKIDFTTPIPGGATPGTNLDPSTYFLLGFLIYSNNTSYASGWVNPADGTATNPDAGRFGDTPGSYTVDNGTYFTGYLPYNLSGFTTNPYQYMQFGIILNADGSSSYANVGNVTIDDIEALPLTNTYALRRTALSGSWGLANAWGDGINAAGHFLSTPQNAGDEASFLNVSAAPVTITLDGDRTVGNLNFFNTGSYIIAQGSGGSLVFNNLGASANLTDQSGNQTLSAPLVFTSTLTVNFFNAPDVVLMSGNISGPGGLIKEGPGTLTLSGSNSYAGPTAVDSGALLITSKSSLSAQTSLTVGPSTGGGVSFTLPSNTGRYTLTGLAVNAGSTLQIGNDGITVNYGSLANDPVTNIQAALTSGYNLGTWTGTGLVSSAAAVNPSKFAVGYLDGDRNSDLIGAHVAPNQLIVRYTLAGDAFLEGSVGFDDLVSVAQNFGKTGQDWSQGNFNYDPNGSVGFADLVNVAQNFGATLGVSNGDSGGRLSPAWQTAVVSQSALPEPASLSLAAMAAAGLLGRRRRSKA